MKVSVQGQGSVTLLQADFVASGGEGSIYCKGGTAYKIYADPKRMVPVGKISELAAISDLDVIKPEAVVLDGKSMPIGYTMRFVRDTMPLCQVFTRSFREREGLDHQAMLGLIQSLQARVEGVHRGGAVVVDLNEMNFLVDRRFVKVMAIDVDSYQTKSYQASAIMPSIRDWTVKPQERFTELSDWFSFACVAFQMFVGIHPYKGQHALKGFEARMRANASVLGPGVSVPSVVYPFSVIPSGYLGWFRAVLQEGKRMPPPTDPLASTGPVATVVPLQPSSAIDMLEILSMGQPILGLQDAGGVQIAWTSKTVSIDGRMSAMSGVVAVAFSAKLNAPVFVVGDQRKCALHLSVHGGTAGAAPLLDLGHLPGLDVMGYRGRIYLRSGTAIVELVLHETADGKVMVQPTTVANVMEHATQMFDGVVVQSMLGATYASVFPTSRHHQQVRLADLDGLKIVDAKYDGGVLMVIAAAGGRYDRWTFGIAPGAEHATLIEKVEDVGTGGLNFVVLDSGVCVHFTEDDQLEMWSAREFQLEVWSAQKLGVSGPVAKKRVDVQSNGLRLVRRKGGLAGIRGSAAYVMRMKP